MADWYRCTDWTEQSEAEFFRRLKRARHQKPQYLVIQASTLVDTGRPEVAPIALALIDLFLQEHFDDFFASGAHRTRAHALLLLERWDEGFRAFEDALAARRVLPNVINNAWLEYPLLVARRRVRHRYDSALNVLKEFVSATALVFPLHEFEYFATLALISADEGDREGAARWANNALAATAKLAPFSRHPNVGLIGEAHADLIPQLQEIAAG